MRFSLEMTDTARADMRELDPVVARRIAAKLRFFASQDNPLIFARRLSNLDADYRFRVGDYRVLFDLRADGIITILSVLRIKHRREAYD